MATLSGKTALVTGASSGIGKSTTELLLKEGAKVYAAARRVEKMRDLENRGATLIALDVTDEESARNAVERIVAEAGAVDILVNNAGYGSYGALEDVPLDEARRQFDVNIFGLARLTQLVLPGMREKGWGRVVNISSIGGKIYTPFGSWYHATKHALEGMTDALRLEVSRFGIDPIIVEPGGIATEWGGIAAENLKKTSGQGAYAQLATRTADRMAEMYDGGRLSGPEVIGKVIVKAVTARRPKTRYAAGSMSGLALFLRRCLSDRAFDRIALSMA
jgi:NAD(P)-dependent dehydrogenase (short-subunit alcohol dehydrogenase family)